MAAPRNTLVDILRRDAESDLGGSEVYRFCPAPDVEAVHWTRAQLDRSARAWATRIAERTSPDTPVLVLASFGRSFALGFLACLYAGRIALPALCPDGARSAFSIRRLRHIIADAKPGLVLSDAPLPASVFERVPELAALPHFALGGSELDDVDARAAAWRRPDNLRAHPAFIQYTSGSTREPRGVVVTHANLFEHQARAHEIFQNPPGATSVSWLPLHHDMGLIGSMLYPLYSQGRGVFLPPTSFLRRPLWWLEVVSQTQARASTAPNFAYEVCARKASDEQVAALKLDNWALTVCGAEPVKAQTMREFCDRFGPAGFRPQTFLPCFGLAEATLVGTASVVGEPVRVHHFDAAALRSLRVVEVDPETFDGQAESHVGCGRPTRDHDLCVVDPITKKGLGDRDVGEIWLRGPSVARDYWLRPEQTRKRLRAEREGVSDDKRDPWMRTGDVGALVDGELFVFGRTDDFIRAHGQWWAPTAFEALVDANPPRGVSGAAVAFGNDKDGLTIAVETRKLKGPQHGASICAAIIEAVETGTGVRPARVLLLAPRTIAKTSSGKKRRYRYRQMDGLDTLPARYVWREGEGRHTPRPSHPPAGSP